MPEQIITLVYLTSKNSLVNDFELSVVEELEVDEENEFNHKVFLKFYGTTIEMYTKREKKLGY